MKVERERPIQRPRRMRRTLESVIFSAYMLPSLHVNESSI